MTMAHRHAAATALLVVALGAPLLGTAWGTQHHECAAVWDRLEVGPGGRWCLGGARACACFARLRDWQAGCVPCPWHQDRRGVPGEARARQAWSDQADIPPPVDLTSVISSPLSSALLLLQASSATRWNHTLVLVPDSGWGDYARSWTSAVLTCAARKLNCRVYPYVRAPALAEAGPQCGAFGRTGEFECLGVQLTLRTRSNHSYGVTPRDLHRDMPLFPSVTAMLPTLSFHSREYTDRHS